MSASNDTKNKQGAREAIAPNAPNRKLECRRKMGEIALNLLPIGGNCPLGALSSVEFTSPLYTIQNTVTQW